MNNVETKALTVLQQNKVAIFVVAFNAESHIESTLKREIGRASCRERV